MRLADSSAACGQRERDIQPSPAFRRGPNNDYPELDDVITVELGPKLIASGLYSPEFEPTLGIGFDRPKLYPFFEQRQFCVKNPLTQLVIHDSANAPNGLKWNFYASVSIGDADGQ